MNAKTKRNHLSASSKKKTREDWVEVEDPKKHSTKKNGKKVGGKKSPPLLEEGDVIDLNDDHEVYTDIPEHFAYSNRRGIFNKVVHHEVRLTGDFDYLQGRYVVYKTAEDGGGAGHGPYDIYPDGHHVYCEKVDRPGKGIQVDFYQTGCFTAMIRDVKPVARAERKWVAPNIIEDNEDER